MQLRRTLNSRSSSFHLLSAKITTPFKMMGFKFSLYPCTLLTFPSPLHPPPTLPVPPPSSLVGNFPFQVRKSRGRRELKDNLRPLSPTSEIYPCNIWSWEQGSFSEVAEPRADALGGGCRQSGWPTLQGPFFNWKGLVLSVPPSSAIFYLEALGLPLEAMR